MNLCILLMSLHKTHQAHNLPWNSLVAGKVNMFKAKFIEVVNEFSDTCPQTNITTPDHMWRLDYSNSDTEETYQHIEEVRRFAMLNDQKNIHKLPGTKLPWVSHGWYLDVGIRETWKTIIRLYILLNIRKIKHSPKLDELIKIQRQCSSSEMTATIFQTIGDTADECHILFRYIYNINTVARHFAGPDLEDVLDFLII